MFTLLLIRQFLFSATLLRRRYAAPQLFGVALVAAGVAVVASPSPSSTAAAATATASVLPAAALYVFSTLFPALDNILKEKVFADAATRLGGGESLCVADPPPPPRVPNNAPLCVISTRVR